MPTIVSQSTCEADYCMASLYVMACTYIKKVCNEMLGYYSDRPLTIPVGTDSQSAMVIANSPKETARKRRITRRYNFVRHAVGIGMKKLLKVEVTKILPTASPSPCQQQHYNSKPIYSKQRWIPEAILQFSFLSFQ
jgi:hypothetical protein